MCSFAVALFVLNKYYQPIVLTEIQMHMPMATVLYLPCRAVHLRFGWLTIVFTV